ncbi:MAG TPA: hypothetical protein VFB32_12265, partial [Rudaea sp.]|nr:hypothetical protein [Rudaea sp.]
MRLRVLFLVLAACCPFATAAAAATAVTSVAVGPTHACLLRSDGAVMCWGDNAYGQLGDGTTVSHDTAQRVAGLPLPATAIALGRFHTCALLNDKTMWCWGGNQGQLGLGDTTDRHIPVRISALSGVIQISAYERYTCAATATNTYCWGLNYEGRLGVGDTSNRTLPTPVSGVGGATSIATGDDHACAVLGGAVKCWGYAALGDGTGQSSNVPVQVAGITSGATSVATGDSHSCALVSGSVLCWGRNDSGQLGIGNESAQDT